MNDDDDGDIDEIKDSGFVYLPVLKGIGSVLLLSFILWMGFMYLYKPPLSH